MLLHIYLQAFIVLIANSISRVSWELPWYIVTIVALILRLIIFTDKGRALPRMEFFMQTIV